MSREDLAKALGQTEQIHPSAKPNGAGDDAGKRGPPKPDDPAFTLEEYAELTRLYGLSPFERDRQIKKSAEELECNVSTLRRILKGWDHGTGDDATTGPGRKLTIVDIEPWPHTVDLASLFDDIAAVVRAYVVTGPGVPETVALWTVHNHALEAAFISPRLVISSPVRRCGKTTLLTLLGAIAAAVADREHHRRRAVSHSRASPPDRAPRRGRHVPQGQRGTARPSQRRALPHELESAALRRSPRRPRCAGVRRLVCDGYCRDRQAAGDDRRPLDPGPMRRRRPDEKVERLRLDRLDEFQHLAQKCRRWALDNLARLRRLDPPVPDALHDRAADNWRTLLAIADAAGGEWPKRARDAALALASIEDTESTGSSSSVT